MDKVRIENIKKLFNKVKLSKLFVSFSWPCTCIAVFQEVLFCVADEQKKYQKTMKTPQKWFNPTIAMNTMEYKHNISLFFCQNPFLFLMEEKRLTTSCSNVVWPLYFFCGRISDFHGFLVFSFVAYYFVVVLGVFFVVERVVVVFFDWR